jgi:hypothetical protein
MVSSGMDDHRGRRRGVAILVLVGAAGAVVMFLLPAVPQPESYHRFADQRTRWGIPHAWNVLSNLPFVVVGSYGLLRLLRRGRRALLPGAPSSLPTRTWQRLAVAGLSGGVVLVGLGSAYYHLAPDSDRLVWDRLPITLVFMTLLSLIVADRVDDRLGARLLLPLVIAGVISAVIWRPLNDLRAYGIVQLGGALAVVLLAAACPPRQLPSTPLWLALAAYGAAKLFEAAPIERGLYRVSSGLLSGHPLKHLFAAAATLALVWMFTTRPRG